MKTVFNIRWPRTWWSAVALGVVAGSALLIIWVNARSFVSHRTAATGKSAESVARTPAPPASPRVAVPIAENVPTSLSNTGEYAENVYDYAKANDWKNADVKLAALRDSVKKARTDVLNKAAEVDRIDGDVAAVDRAVTARDRQSSIREANQVTLDVANMTASYKLIVPVDVTRLDYYGRELEVWVLAKDMDKLQANASEMGRTWETLRPSVEARSATEAKKFDALVAQAESAKTPADYARVSTPLLNEVDTLEKLFQRDRRSNI
jgi:hypothetical protein